jgi:rRNA processing protein Gar1
MAQSVANIYMAQSTGTVNDVTGTVNWHSKSSHKLTGTVNDIIGTVNDEYMDKYRNTKDKY